MRIAGISVPGSTAGYYEEQWNAKKFLKMQRTYY
jgi:hypothetical protein